MTTRAIDILQGQIEQREKAYAEAKRRAMESAREAGEYLREADRIDADIAALRDALKVLESVNTAKWTVNVVAEGETFSEHARAQARGNTGGIAR